MNKSSNTSRQSVLAKKLQEYEENGIMPYFVVVNAVIFKGDKFLIARRSSHETYSPGKWCIPGGKLETSGDKVFNVIQATLAREVMEEVGVEVESNLTLVSNNTFVTHDGRHMISLVFACDWLGGEAQPLEDMDKVEWTTESRLADFDLAPNVKDYILSAIDSRS